MIIIAYDLTFIAQVIIMHFDIQTVNPYIRVAIPSVLTAGTEIKRRIIFDYELIYIESGAFTLNYNECDYICSPGRFLFLRPGIPHSFTGIQGALSQPHIHFDVSYSGKSRRTPICFKDLCDLSPREQELLQRDLFESYPKTPFVQFSDMEQALQLFYGIIEGTQCSELERKAMLTRLIDRMICDNFPDCFQKKESTYGIAQQLKDYMDTEQGLSARLSDFEKQFSYSKYHLERQFKKQYGISIMTYRNSKRMEVARRLLQTETVSSVSELLGFSSIYAFSRAYKQHFGIAPSMQK